MQIVLSERAKQTLEARAKQARPMDSEALAAYRQLQGLMREHAGCRIHVYATAPEPQFTLRQPSEWYADGFAEVVFDLFLKAAGIIGQELRGRHEPS